ncbi:SDR family NAD(P)-dependent oxidoreductase [Kordia jejudonensis]|uniref:SDR family NAD(P)-dependent oxidoreductase n=1 Tax=Kordia jejudonensis TaxID=1348245 RepID=UPI0006296896|nr:SDR family oxidoreductase [Kordia jejudonensis]
MKTVKKTALVTGAASGLGFEFAVLLAKDNYNLILVDIDVEKLGIAMTSIRMISDVRIKVIIKDLCEMSSSEEIMMEIGNTPIDVLINNAGFGLFGKFSNTNWERESQMLQLHVYTTTYLTKLLLKQMQKRGSGKILNVSSLAAFQPGPLMSLYYASKAYILSFSEAIANELKGTGITVTALCPGQTNTGFQKVVAESCTENTLKFNMACPRAVAKYGYGAMQQGKTVAIPGQLNRLLSNIPRFIPRRLVTMIVRRLQESNRE